MHKLKSKQSLLNLSNCIKIITKNIMSKHSDNRNIRVIPFLDAYEKQESLWNPALESYKNKIARDEAYAQIIKELNSPSLTIHDIKLKVKSIRTTYTKELRLLTKHKDEGKPYNPKLFWFSRANSFLKNVSLSRDKRNIPEKSSNEEYKSACVINYISGISHRPVVTDDGNAEELSNTEEDPVNSSSSTYEYKTINADLDLTTGNSASCVATEEIHDDNNRKTVLRNKNDETSQHDLHEAIVNIKYCGGTIADTHGIGVPNAIIEPSPASNSLENERDDEYDHFCRSVAAQLRRITDSYSRALAKLKIQQILFEAETGHYRNCPTVPVSNLYK